MHTLRARFKKDIVAEFLPPRGRDTRKVIIFAGGMPTVPSKGSVLEFFSKKGYWVFFPRYRGSWESAGSFLKLSPERDIVDVIDQLPRGFISLWDGKKYKIKPRALYIFGSSFGGPAALLASRDPRVTKVVTASAVVDWRADSKIEPLDWLGTFTKEAFGEGYRFRDRDWKKLKTGKFYNPASHAREIDGKKVFMIHAKDDDLVLPRPVQKFAKETGAKLLMLKRGGHLGLSVCTRHAIYKKIKKFLNSSI
jgi:dipeptidyl aminopeptidase/acylaminoacyl peptidase